MRLLRQNYCSKALGRDSQPRLPHRQFRQIICLTQMGQYDLLQAVMQQITEKGCSITVGKMPLA